MPDSVEVRLAAVEKKIDELKKRPKDPWDIFQIVATLLIPASITFVGYYYTENQKRAEIQNSANIAAQQSANSLMQVKVGQAQVVATFMESLVSDKPQKQHLAIAAVLVALPDDGPRLVKILSEDSSQPKSQAVALTLLDQRRSSLIRDLLGIDKPARIVATTELSRGWQTDDKLIGELLQSARAHMDNGPGLIDVLTVLENVSPTILSGHQADVDDFTKTLLKAYPGAEAQGHVDAVKSRMASKAN
jgi:hypothetical protein